MRVSLVLTFPQACGQASPPAALISGESTRVGVSVIIFLSDIPAAHRAARTGPATVALFNTDTLAAFLLAVRGRPSQPTPQGVSTAARRAPRLYAYDNAGWTAGNVRLWAMFEHEVRCVRAQEGAQRSWMWGKVGFDAALFVRSTGATGVHTGPALLLLLTHPTNER